VRNDDPTQTDLGLAPSTDDRPATARSKAFGVAPLVLAPLIAGTCWVVASSLSPWLVPPYLLLMALFLLPSAGRRIDARAAGASAASTADASTLSSGRSEAADDAGWTSNGSASGVSPASSGASEVDPAASASAATIPVKGRRGKGRSRRPRPSAGVPEATWIEVGPGKFVRAEASALAAEAGPHASVADRAEAADLTPASPSDVDEPALSGSDEAPGPVEVPQGIAPGPGAEAEPEAGPAAVLISEGAGPGASPELGFIPEVAPPDPDEEPSTADGIMPQVACPFVVADRADPELDLDADDARDRADRALRGPEVDHPAQSDPAWSSSAAGPPPFFIEGADLADPDPLGSAEARALPPEPPVADPLADERWSGAEPPQDRDQAERAREVATGEGGSPPEPGVPIAPGRSGVMPEEADAPRWDAGGWSDSPGDLVAETPPGEDEPDPDPILDRIELAEGANLDRPEAPPAGGDQPVAPGGQAWWPRRRSAGRRTRLGLRLPATRAEMPPRHPGRSRETARPPVDPRRPSRRGLGRPRQGSRTFPPRSPPRGRRHRGG